MNPLSQDVQALAASLVQDPSASQLVEHGAQAPAGVGYFPAPQSTQAVPPGVAELAGQLMQSLKKSAPVPVNCVLTGQFLQGEPFCRFW